MELAYSEALGWLFSRDDVVSVMIGRRMRAGARTDETCIVVGVKNKLPASQVPPDRLIPRQVGGVGTDVVTTRPRLTLNVESFTRLQGGASIGPEDADQAGTLGGIFWDPVTEQQVGLTNYHVLAVPGGSPSVPSDYVVHPAISDGGLDDGSNRCGTLTAYMIDETGDAAVFRVHKEAALTQYSSHVTIVGVDSPSIEQVVEKVGRTTGLTRAVVNAEGYVLVDYTEFGLGNISVAAFACIPEDDPDEEIVDSGDSGSLVYDPATGVALGLTVSMSTTSPVTLYACHLDDVLLALGLVPYDLYRYERSVVGTVSGSIDATQSCTGTVSCVDTAATLSVSSAVLQDWETVYATFDEWAVAQGFDDEASLLFTESVRRALNEHPYWAWFGDWVLDHDFSVDDCVEHDATMYRALVDHTSSAADEPGVGVYWADYWEEVPPAYSTVDEFLLYQNFDSLEDFLAAQEIPSLAAILASRGVTFG